MLALVFNQRSAQPATSAGSGGPFGEGLVGVYRRERPKAPKRVEPVSKRGVAFASPGEGISEVPPGSAFVAQPAIVLASPGEGTSVVPLGRAVAGRAAYVIAAYGSASSAVAPGRAIGAAAVGTRGADARASLPRGGAIGAAAVRARAPEARSEVRPGGAVAGHNPSDLELAAIALLLDDDFLEDAA